MKIHQVSGPPSSALALALAQFEMPFTYPLGPGKFFRISHGEDYSLFFRAQGNGCCFIAEREGQVVGTLGAAIRQLWMPNGTERIVAYVGDLKIAASARSGTVLVRLARAAEAWMRPKVEAGFGVVMGGTTMTPEAYTGRGGIPGFQDLGRVVIFRISGSAGVEPESGHFLTDREAGLACYRHLSLGRYACPTVEAERRSQITPVWLMNSDGSACGMLEDTRKAKRLITGEGSELLSAHLSCFACSAIAAGAELIGVALRRAVRSGFPALFVSVAEPDAQELRAALHDFEVLPAPAIVYGTGLAAGVWNINTSEI
ncbi:MAG TPA: N-acetyltransferase [Verrucomicrobiae bacterium]|nr:N-acetyltransferase [Verrucomicrobiae bacterium]